MDLLLQVNDFDYYGMIKDDGFFIGARNWKVYLGGSSQNSFAPVAVGKITTENGVTTLSVTIRMNIIIQVIFVPIHIMTLCTVLLIPFFWLLLYFAFVKPAKRLRDGIKAEIYYDEVIK